MRRWRAGGLSSTDFDPVAVLQRARRLDSNALSALHDHYYPKILRYAVYRLGERTACEEIAAEVFQQFLEALNRHRLPQRNLPGWLFATAAGGIDAHLRQQIQSKPPYAREVRDEASGQGKYAVLFKRSLQQISPERQHFLALRFSQDIPLEEIARWLGRSEREIRALQFQALNALLSSLGGKAVSRQDEGMERALQVCLHNLEAGGRLEELAASYPKWSEELHALLEVAQFSRFPGGIDPRPKIRSEAGWEITETAQAHSKAEFLQAARRMIPRSPPVRLIKGLVLVFGLVVLLAACGGALASLSRHALPGNPLYPAKRAFEQVRLSWTVDPAAKLELELLYDQRRLSEVEGMLRLGWIGPVVFSAALSQVQETQWTVGGVRVVVPPDAQIVGSLYPGFAVTVQGEITVDGAVKAQRIQMREFNIQGKVQSITAENLVIGDLQVALSPETIQLGTPLPGSQVILWLLMPSDLLPQARMVEVLE